MSQPITPAPHLNPPPSASKITFEEYLFYEGEPDVLYELYRGQLIPMPTPTGLHSRICNFLVYKLQNHLVTQNLEFVATTTTGVRTEADSSRIPDVVVCSQDLWDTICARRGAGVLDFNVGEVPLLVIEVTSDNWREDYIRKRAEYALINIPEYWIVDANKGQVWLLSHPENDYGYEQITLKPGEILTSALFPDFTLSIEQLLNPPTVETLIRQEQAQQQQREQDLLKQADEQRQRAERLASQLRQLGIDPEGN
jgi:Uma2 family endonuclease